MIGERLGKWAIYKELGRGGMGRVYLAQEEMTGRQAAIKVLAAELAQEAGFLHRFQREIETLRTLSHPNIVSFYEAGFENSLYFYAMEYIEGQSLDEVVHKEGRLPWKEVLDLGLQVSKALKHAHDHGIIHRDIKPANLLRTPTGLVKLTDFGIAKVFAGTHLTATGGVVGTAEYLSPEQASGKQVTKRSDLYSLGVVLYTLVTGRVPFTGASFVELLHKHRYAQFDARGEIALDLPYELDEIICQLLAKEPEQRPADAMVLSRQLESVRNKLQRKDQPTALGPHGAPNALTLAENKAVIDLEDKPGPATLMSRLVRDELARQKQGGFVQRLANNPIALLLVLALCCGLIAWRLIGGEADDRNSGGNDTSASAPAAMSEAERFYRQGERLRAAGNPAEAKQIWQALIAVFATVPGEEEWVRRAQEGVAAIDSAAADSQRWDAIRARVAEGKKLAQAGQLDEAKKIWRGIDRLYGNDPAPAARTIVAQVRQLLDGGKE
jgi:serine/threonine-protein kinase